MKYRLYSNDHDCYIGGLMTSEPSDEKIKIDGRWAGFILCEDISEAKIFNSECVLCKGDDIFIYFQYGGLDSVICSIGSIAYECYDGNTIPTYVISLV